MLEKRPHIFTARIVNGYGWNALSEDERRFFVHGIWTGLGLCKSCDEEMTRVPALNTAEDVASVMSSFYKDNSNILVPVMVAYQYAVQKLKGASVIDLETLAALGRSRTQGVLDSNE